MNRRLHRSLLALSLATFVGAVALVPALAARAKQAGGGTTAGTAASGTSGSSSGSSGSSSGGAIAESILSRVPPSDVLTAVLASVVSLVHSSGRADRYPLREKCIATVFGTPGDRWAGGNAMCLGKPVGPYTLGIAHRSLPCGTPVLVRNVRTGRAIVVPVIDRGPYGALLEDGTWAVKRSRTDPGRWRGCADLTPLTGMLIGHDGWDRVHLSYARAPRPVL